MTMPGRLTVWAARTFGTAVHSLKRLRANPDGCDLRLLVSHVRPDSPTLTAADQDFLEPMLVGDAWVDWALGVCASERVDVLWVTREARAAAGARAAFAAVGTQLLVPSAASLEATHAKSLVYLRAEACGLPTPPWRQISGPDQARDALSQLAADAPHRIGVKPDSGQGAEGVFRLIPDGDDLPNGLDLPVERWLAHVARRPEVQWLALPWMPGEEHSVDALVDLRGSVVASAVRTKLDGTRDQVAWHDAELTRWSADLLADLQVGPLANVQWREHLGQRVLLEVNPRPSGGLFRTCDALGADLLWAAIRQQVTGQHGLWPVPLTVERPVRTTSVSTTLPLASAADGLAEEPRSA